MQTKEDIKLLSIILPVYNEKSTFQNVIEDLLKKKLPGIEKEIIIIESNSTDGTRDVVEKYSRHPEVKVVYEDKPMGKGHAVRSGLDRVNGDYILIQDGDLEYSLDDYEILMNELINNKRMFVLGSRHINNWKIRKFSNQPIVSFFINIGHLIFTGLLNLFLGTSMKDPFTMYKVFDRRCIYGLKFTANRFDFDWELVIKLVRNGYIPYEVPVQYKSRSFKEGKKVSIIYDPLTWIVALFRYRFCKL